MGYPKRKTTYVAALALVFVCLISCQQQRNYPNWLLGSWNVKYNEFKIIESWEKAKDGYKATTVWNDDGNRTIEHVNLFFLNKILVYRVETKNKTVDFKCSDPYDDTLVFVNEKNDYPKRIVYVKPKDKKNMRVWIENYANDPAAEFFDFQKTK